MSLRRLMLAPGTPRPGSVAGSRGDRVPGRAIARAVAAAAAVLLLASALAGCDAPGDVPGGVASAFASAPPAEAATPADTVEPTPEPLAPVSPEPTPARAVDLRKAVAAGEVAVAGKGDGLQRLDITLTSKTDEPLRVVVNAGTVFDAASAGTQAMVVLAKEVVPLEPRAKEVTTLEVACSEMHKDQPTTDDTFRIVKRSLPKDLTALLAVDAFLAADFRIQQFAVWTILDDPARDGFVRLGTFGVGSGPSAKEIAAIRKLFAAAGIDPDAYRATR